MDTLHRNNFGVGKSHRNKPSDEVLTFDIMRQQKIKGTMCSTDAKSFNDRVVHSVALLCFQLQNIPQKHFTEHSISMVFESLIIRYGENTLFIPVKGIFQGNWAVRKQKCGVKFENQFPDLSFV